MRDILGSIPIVAQINKPKNPKNIRRKEVRIEEV